MIDNRVNTIAAAILLIGSSPVWAQDAAATATGDMGGMDHDAGGMDHGTMSMQGGAAPPDARDPHAWSGGEDFGPIPRPRMGDEERFGALVLQPRVEANVYGKRDAGRETGSGLSDVSAGLRLRYEIRREFAPYVGLEWAGQYGATADYARAAGDDTRETRIVAGLRVWY